ncbi:hypothetical protein GLOTRDRAFT_128710 [Gloeophyllum trabeum ATCC 11539]|uniref:Uncharacterized protein n=1 Tax=Gloeophyllum trabeum (strain ATCC 11539 / FP-39264 / Madison 617) TaxID=670483 RepID=S7RUA9_GLOTA|nr:uncharacterized protein GLOTRDRAFT_128710 [Gloeophyllum trabeum ATCC 11539]EPQ56774.1 hypothetical protein GLOTRDRAFT_128710 [Gloeophyllum trabeum ATCC 11539]
MLRWEILHLQMIALTGTNGNAFAAHYIDVTQTWVDQIQERFQLRTEVRERQDSGPPEASLLTTAMLDKPYAHGSDEAEGSLAGNFDSDLDVSFDEDTY